MVDQKRVRAREIVRQLLEGPSAEAERLDVEIKGAGQLDSAEFAAVIAKAVMCLANHGGGILILGFRRDQHTYVEDPLSEDMLRTWEATRFHDMLRTYMAPVPECELLIAPGNSSSHPMILVPSHGTTPVVCIRDSQYGTRRGAVYIRKPGPLCEEPHSPPEWTPLIRRATQFDRDEFIAIIRGIIGARQLAPAAQDDFATSLEDTDIRFSYLQGLDPETARLSFGRWVTAHQLIPPPPPVSLSRLSEILRLSKGRETGWPIGVILTKEELRPHPFEEGIEAWIDSHVMTHGLDYWYARRTGFFYQTRAFEEDLELQPGAGVLDVTLPIWRMGEAMLHASRVARNYGSPVEHIRFYSRYQGLAGRVLWSHRPEIDLFERYVCRSDVWSNQIDLPVEFDREGLVTMLHRLLTPLYEQFDLFEMPIGAYTTELSRMLDRR